MDLKLKPTEQPAAQPDKDSAAARQEASPPPAPPAGQRPLPSHLREPPAQTTAAAASIDDDEVSPGDDEEDASLEEKESLSKKMSKGLHSILGLLVYFFDWLRRHLKMALFVSALIIALAVGYGISKAFYSQYLLNSAEIAFERKDYEEVIDQLTSYVSHEPENIESVFMLVQSYMYRQNPTGAENTLVQVEKTRLDSANQKKYEFYLALLALLNRRPGEARVHLNKISLIDADYLPGIYLLAAAYFYNNANYIVAAQVLEEGILKSKGANEATQETDEINFARQLLHDQYPAIISEELPLPFDSLTEAPALAATLPVPVYAQAIELQLSVDTFYNFYYVPTDQKLLREERLSVLENMQLLQVAAAMLHEEREQTEREQTQKYLDAFAQYEANTKSPPLSALYLSAFIAAKDNDYARAAEIYQQINLRFAGSADANLMRASALWAANGGDAPTQEMLDLYAKMLQQQANSVPAIINNAYLHIHQNEFEQARALLVPDYEETSGNFYILYHLSLLDILSGEWERAQTNLQALFTDAPDSQVLSRALTYVLLLQGKHAEAVAILQNMKKYSDAPSLYLVIALLYSTNDQPLRAAAELTAGRVAFPDDRDILFELILEYAKQGDAERYAALREFASAEERARDYRALLAVALMSRNAVSSEPFFDQAFVRAATPKEKEQVLSHWLRRLLYSAEPERAQRVVPAVAELYEVGVTPPASIAALQLWVQATAADAEEKSILAAQIIALLEGDDPLSVDTQTDIARALIALGDNERAVKVLEPLAEDYSSSQQLLETLQLAYTNLQDTPQVESIEQRLQAVAAKEQGSKDKESISTATEQVQAAGLAFTASGETSLRSVGSDDDNVVASGSGRYISQLNQAIKQKNYPEAISIYEKLLAEDESTMDPALIYQNRGVLYFKLQQHEKAAEDFVKALSFTGEGELSAQDRNNVLFNYSLALIGSKKYQEVKKVLQELIDADPENLRTLLLYSQVLDRLKEVGELATVYDRIIELSPEQIGVYIELAQLHRFTGHLEKALETMQAALKVAPRDRRLHQMIAQVYGTMGNDEKAQEHLDIMKGL